MPAPAELLALQLEIEVPLGIALPGIAQRRPAAAVPQHHRAAAVLALRNGALEVAVRQRMVLDVHREALLAGDEARPLGHRPALQYAVHLQAQVVVQAPGRVLLDQVGVARSEEHTSELQSLMRTSSAAVCLKKKK